MPPTNYPGSIDSLTDPTSGQFQNAPSHSTIHADANDAIVAIQNFLGTSSAPKFAPITSPTFVGVPTTPNVSGGDNSTKIANTDFVTSALVTLEATLQGEINAKANTASPTFTGIPAGPTAANGTNTTQLATTAFVLANAGTSGEFEGTFVYDIRNYGTVDPTGSVDSTAAILAAIAAADAAQGGIVWLGPGTFKTSSVLTFNKPNVSMMGAGQGATIIQPTSAITGDTIRVQMNPFMSGGLVFYATAFWRDFTVDGTNAGANSIGFHYGDIVGGKVDICVHSFTASGAKNVVLDNNTNWTEENIVTIISYNSNFCIYFEETGGSNSFGYNEFDFFLQPWGSPQIGLSVPDNVWVYHCRFRLRGNNWTTMIQGRAASSYGGLLWGSYDIQFENMTSGTTPIVIPTSGVYFHGSGIVDNNGNDSGTSSYAGAGCFFSGWWGVTGFTPSVGMWTTGTSNAVGGVLTASIDSSATASVASPTFVSGTAQQLNTTSDTTLYIEVTTSASLVVAMGHTSGASDVTPISSIVAALGLQTLKVPRGWYVKITGTIADLNINAVTC